MKRLFAISLVLLQFFLTVPAHAENEAASGVLFDSFAWTLNTDGVLTIEGEGEMPDVIKTNEMPWYDHRDNIVRIFLKGNIARINTNIFSISKNLEVIVVGSDNGNYSTENGVLFNADCTELICYPQNKSDEYYAISAGVKEIASYAFNKNTHIKSIDIADGLLSIGSGAFSYCGRLTDITIPDSVNEIGSYAFQFCYNLKTIAIPKNVKEIDYMTFSNCRSLENVSLPESATIIADGAFEKCENLKTISIPKGVTKICYAAFADCGSLKSIDIPASITKIENDAFARCTSLREIRYNGTEDEWRQIVIDSSNEAYISAATLQFEGKDTEKQPTQDLQLPQIPPESPSNIQGAVQDIISTMPVKENQGTSQIVTIIAILAVVCVVILIGLRFKRKR